MVLTEVGVSGSVQTDDHQATNRCLSSHSRSVVSCVPITISLSALATSCLEIVLSGRRQEARAVSAVSDTDHYLWPNNGAGVRFLAEITERRVSTEHQSDIRALLTRTPLFAHIVYTLSKHAAKDWVYELLITYFVGFGSGTCYADGSQCNSLKRVVIWAYELQ